MNTEILPAWTPQKIARHYGFPQELRGKGQSVAVISLGGAIDLKELRSNFLAMKLPIPDIQVINTGAISIEQNKQPCGETHIDVEVLGTICPGAKLTIYRGANPTGFADAVERAIMDNNQVISISWGYPETSTSASSKMEKVLEIAKKTNTTVCVSTGDQGASCNVNNQGMAIQAEDGKAHVSYPASSPMVLACGGTQLVKTKKGRSEVVWNQTIGQPGAATGGGVSDVFKKPVWQQDASMDIKSVNSGKTGRTIPDVAGLASRGDWEIFIYGKGEAGGGTSAVAPLWAAFITLVNEARSNEGKGPLGFINEKLYQLMNLHRELCRDITSGTNRLGGKGPGYDAQVGFDACCGWGVPVGDKLFPALKAL